MATFILVDVSNLFFRCRHVVRGDTFTKTSMALHIMLRSLKKIWKQFDGTHLVFCMDNTSWRKEVYPKYKAHRKLAALQRTRSEIEEDEIFQEVFSDFTKFIDEKTNSTVLNCPRIEADDFIARWIQNHPNDNHIILSSDSDFIQLLSKNVIIYDAIKEITLKDIGIFDKNNEKLEFEISSSTSKLKAIKINEDFIPDEDWYKFALFLKIVRGDTGDNIFSAFPKVRMQGSVKKEKPNIMDTWEDRKIKGYAWNNFMLQSWEKIIELDADKNAIKKEVLVKDEFEMNQTLIDLTKQPETIKELMDDVIVQSIQKPKISQIGIHFMRFCDKHKLEEIGKFPQEYAKMFNESYS